MLKYLQSLHQLQIPPSYSGCLLVTGNEAADMDSCCSALLAAYLESSTSPQNTTTFPLINIPRQDLRLRRDIEYVFQSLGIDPEWLLFSDDLPPTSANTSLFLVDHNAPTISGSPVKVIDHHAIEGATEDLARCDPSILVKSGSCMSAVVNYYAGGEYRDAVRKLFATDGVLAPLAMAPIVQDTSNLTKKVESEDISAMEFLNGFDTRTFSPVQNFAVMSSEKGNITGFTPADLLRKDYKEWGTVGIASLPKLFPKLFGADYMAHLGSAMIAHAQNNRLSVMVALGSGSVKKQHVRELAFYGPTHFDIAAQCPNLKLQLKGENDGVRFYDQLNADATRKQVAPQLRAALAAYKGN